MEITIETQLGKITGTQQAGHQSFLGIHYAMAPTDELRYAPPLRLKGWQGVFDATHYASIAPQAHPDTPPIELEETENCLTLNIFTPAADNQYRPVMVYIHGGGFVIDTGSRPRTYGGFLAATGDVVVVTIEYRMGAFGFLYGPGISPNLGLQDQICALEWVKDHIADFGGDPGNVTIFGQSAGAMSVACLLTMPGARGLFQKAVLESGAFPLESPAENRRLAEEAARDFLKALKLDTFDLDALRRLPWTEILRAEKEVTGTMFSNKRPFFPIHDGVVVPEDVHAAIRSGSAQGIPILIGINSEELPVLGAMSKGVTNQLFTKIFIQRTLIQNGLSLRQVRTLLAGYRSAFASDTRGSNAAYNQLLSDSMFRTTAIQLAEDCLAAGQPVYFYQFSHGAPPIGMASHCLELYFVFGTLGTTDIAEWEKLPADAAERDLANATMQAWSAFARTGVPASASLPDWPAYDTARRATMVLDLKSQVVDAPNDALRQTWSEFIKA
jgi:para-nitrobenzyl esterase